MLFLTLSSSFRNLGIKLVLLQCLIVLLNPNLLSSSGFLASLPPDTILLLTLNLVVFLILAAK